MQLRNQGAVPVLGANGQVGSHDTAIEPGPGVLLGRAGQIGKATYWPGPYWPLNTSLYVKDFRSNDPLFTYYLLDSIDFSSFNSGGAQPMLNRNFIAPIRIRVPPLPEQRKIAEILRTWDDAISLETAGRDLQERRYLALVDRMTSSAGETVRLSSVTHELTNRNGAAQLGTTSVMGVSNTKGLFPMREQTMSNDLSRYKVLPPLGFAYNPMRINVGSIAMSREASKVLVSPDYVLFDCDGARLLPEYVDHLLKTKWWARQMQVGGSGSVRSRVYYGDLASIHISLPPVSEQADFCQAADSALTATKLSDRRIELLRLQKRGLMQKLLTGEIRVETTSVTDRRRSGD